MTRYYKFKALLQKEGWLQPAYVGVDPKGDIAWLSNKPPSEGIAIEAVEGFALPGFQNAHSHAFQYAMAGLAENHPAGTHDDFWTWREAMYRCALAVNPDEAEAIAAMVYAEMIRFGYTHVAEFHYLHHDKDGKPYANLAEMGERMLSAAKTAGIRITLIPVFYQKGNFGVDPVPQQRRFISKSSSEYLKLLEATKKAVEVNNFARLGFSVHSLRAVDLTEVKTTFNQGPKDLPFHLHVSEQKKEVSDCVAHCGKRPAQWLLENLPVDSRFNLVHSTHLDDNELKGLAHSGANVILCPSTEGSLGDGIFRMKEYVKLGGRWCIGTDSHIGLDPLEEFRMIDYRQRLVSHQRNTFEGDSAQYLISEEIESGRKAMGVSIDNHFAIGKQFDAVIYSSEATLAGHTSLSSLAATLVYAAAERMGTIIGGEWIYKSHRHREAKKIKADFSAAMRSLKTR